MEENTIPVWFYSYRDKMEEMEREITYLKEVITKGNTGELKKPFMEIKLDLWTYDICPMMFGWKHLINTKVERDFEVIKHVYLNPLLSDSQHSIRMTFTKQLEYWVENNWKKEVVEMEYFDTMIKCLQKFYFRINREKDVIQCKEIPYIDCSTYIFTLTSNTYRSKMYKLLITYFQSK
jgi:hypothetical protein